MGCWNGTCGVSRLPIKSGDDVVLFILEENAFHDGGAGGVCYTNALWSPLFVPLFGKYDDYGRIEDIEAGSESVLEFFNSKIDKGIKVRKDRMKMPDEADTEADRHDHEPFASLDDLIDAMAESRLYFNDNFMSEKRIGTYGFVMIHTHIYKELIASYEVRIPYSNTQTMYSLVYKDRLGRTIDARTPYNDDDPISRMKRMMSMMDDRIFTHHDGRTNRQLLDYINENKSIDVEAMAQVLTDYASICNVFDLLRTLWQPQAGAGSQGSEYALHKVLAEAVATVVWTNHFRWEEDNEDPDGDVDIWSAETAWWYDRNKEDF